eukprot:2998583-Amphidinium_carterae.2
MLCPCVHSVTVLPPAPVALALRWRQLLHWMQMRMRTPSPDWSAHGPVSCLSHDVPTYRASSFIKSRK